MKCLFSIILKARRKEIWKEQISEYKSIGVALSPKNISYFKSEPNNKTEKTNMSVTSFSNFMLIYQDKEKQS